MKNVSYVCNYRVRVIFIVITLSYLLIIGKLFNTQVIQNKYWMALAKAQHYGQNTLPAERGEILSSDNFPLVLNSYKYDLFIDPSNSPKNFSDIEDLFKIVYKSEFDKSISKRDITFIKNKEEVWKAAVLDKSKKFAYFEKGINKDTKTKIQNLNLPWVGFTSIPIRSYPDSESYSHILGFVGKDSNGTETGYFGLEGFYNGDLTGVDGYLVQEESANGSPILFGQYNNVKPINGGSLLLTIDRTMQTTSFTALKKSVEKYEADSGIVLIVNSKTGEILTMAQYPTFDPNNYNDYYSEDPTIFINKSISSTYEPGSVIKALTMSSAIDLNIVTPETIMVDDGPVEYSGYLVDNWDLKHHGTITMTQILQLSDNIGAAWVGNQVGDTGVYKYFTQFGMNSKLKIDLEGEEMGKIRDSSQWQDIDLATASFGQGISATPLQVLMAFSTIANDGILMKPYIVKKIIYSDKTINNDPQQIRRVISEKTSKTMLKMLTEAVSGGEAKYFVSKKYYVAGKTGTAQIAENGEYLKDATNATFVGFLPSFKEFVMLVKLEKPKASVYASETAVPLWMDIAEKLANYMGLPPDKYE